jgi:hypothetical protein
MLEVKCFALSITLPVAYRQIASHSAGRRRSAGHDHHDDSTRLKANPSSMIGVRTEFGQRKTTIFTVVDCQPALTLRFAG